MDGFIHAHPVLTVVAFTWVVLVVFVLALFDGATPPAEDIQASDGDWLWPEREAT